MDDVIKVVSLVAAFIAGLTQAYTSAQEFKDYCQTKKTEKSNNIENTTSQTQET